MADVVKANTAAIAAYGATCAGMASEVIGAASVDSGASLAAAVPTFGLIGQDFLAAFAAAQGSYLTSVAEIAAVHSGTSVSAFGAAGLLEGTEMSSAATFAAMKAAL